MSLQGHYHYNCPANLLSHVYTLIKNKKQKQYTMQNMHFFFHLSFLSVFCLTVQISLSLFVAVVSSFQTTRLPNKQPKSLIWCQTMSTFSSCQDALVPNSTTAVASICCEKLILCGIMGGKNKHVFFFVLHLLWAQCEQDTVCKAKTFWQAKCYLIWGCSIAQDECHTYLTNESMCTVTQLGWKPFFIITRN